MRTPKRLPLSFLVLLLICGEPVTGLADETRGRAERELASSADLYWYDGGRRRGIQRLDNFRVVQRSDGAMSIVEHASRASAASGTPQPLEVYSDSGMKMTMPGGVIVKFADHWSVDQITNWMRAGGFDEFHAVIGNHIWMIATAPGREGLRLANEIHESGDVVYASPNWARPRFIR